MPNTGKYLNDIVKLTRNNFTKVRHDIVWFAAQYFVEQMKVRHP